MSTILNRIPRRMYSQYADKPKFVDWLAIARKMGGDMASAINAVLRSYDIDTTTGEQLDAIGRIVVIDRGFLNYIEIDPIEFASDEDAWEFGDPDAVFSSATVAEDQKMADGLYRLLIKAKILKNNGDATAESIIEQMVLLVGADFVRVNDTDDMRFSVEYSSNTITQLQRWALLNENIVQKPQGVLFDGFFELSEMVEFGDMDSEFGDNETMFSDYIGG